MTFVPCFLWIFVGAPYVERLRGNRALASARSALTAAVVGVILNLAFWFALHTVFSETRPFAAGPVMFDLPLPSSLNPWALALAVAAVLAVFRLKVGMVPTLVACAATGVALHLVGMI